ncbi:carbohydrate-binding protein [Flammeovirga pectinis]|uniref:Carbohydrate-binding protein n=1 Tax=Flammeovirga pectinis TaxID=2494373 RepID=A0A3Q9FSP9_9BACT|nr:carbohydrate-binding protein [Flammeovirga pectinis]AZQ65560.1 carbohydrate-binding protein [Flammeovirga pectinis]
MKKLLFTTSLLLVSFFQIFAQDWNGIEIPANAGNGKEWELQENVSDDFNYNFNSSSWSNFGEGNKWYNFYHNSWDGPGYTYWKNENVTVDGSNLVINVGYTSENGKGGNYGVASGCVTSNNKVLFPVYVESSISVANISLASCFWLLSPDDTEEIDIIENYGGVNGYKHLTHISHHSFIRSPFTDYQPRDTNSWYPDSRVNTNYGWGDWCYNNGNRRYMRMGVNWISPKHFEYFIDGELVRVMYYNAIATNYNGTWKYTYFNSKNWDVNGYKLPTNNASGYTDVTTYATSSTYNFDKLKEASNASNGFNVIDPAWFQGGDDSDTDGNGVTQEARGFTKELDIIINMESQTWLASSTPSQSDLENPAKNQMKVDWVRVYKPVSSNPGADVAVQSVTLNPANASLENGETSNLTGRVLPSNATDQTITFTSNNTNVVSVNQSGLLTANSVGTAVITATSTDGGFTATSNITVEASGSGGPIVSNLEIEAENFNATGGTFNDGVVPFGANTSSVGVNYINAGDYMEYEVAITEMGDYSITYHISSPSDNAKIACYVNGNLVADDNVQNNGQWDAYQALTASNNLSLTTGNHTIKIEASGSNDWQWNLDKMNLEKLGSGTNPEEPTPPLAEDFVIQAEDYNETSGSFNDGFVPFGVNASANGINYVNAEDWADYTVYIPEAGTFNVTYTIATPSDNAQIEIVVDGVGFSRDNVQNTGGWESYTSVLAANKVTLSAGDHTIRVFASGSNDWQWNLDKITFNAVTTNSRVLSLEDELQGVAMYPNPVKNTLNFSGLSSIASIKVYNTIGIKVLSENVTNSLDISSLQNGIYIVEVIQDNRRMVKKIIINK